jgi:hypothetical protein
VQFQVWGRAGPALPPVPPGWTAAERPPELLPPWTPTPEERRRGLVVFARSPFATVTAETTPAAAERTETLVTFAAQGEYEPVTFALRALRPLSSVAVRVGELRSSSGGSIPADFIDVRVVRAVRVPVDRKAKTYRLEPFLLEKRDAFAIAAGETARVWLTLKVPDQAPAGVYRGRIAITVDGQERAGLDLLVRVLPFRLPPMPVEAVMFAPRPAESDELLRKELLDMREHGIVGPAPALHAVVKSRDRRFGPDDVAATRKESRRLLHLQRETFGPWRFPLTLSAGFQIVSSWDAKKGWFVYWKHSAETDEALLKALGLLEQAAREAGASELRAYVVDEAGAHGLLEEAVYYYGLLKRRAPKLQTYATMGGGLALGVDELAALSEPVDFLSTNRFTPDIARALDERGKPYGIYNGAGRTPVGARFFFGFYGWKTGAAQVGQWAYWFGNGVFEGEGLRRADEGYVYRTPDGPLPSLMWEAVREGIDDYRYLDFLWRRIAAAKASRDARLRKTAENTERALVRLLSEIGYGFQALRGQDRTPPPHPSTLRKWRWQVARWLLECGAAGAGLGASKRISARPSPLQLPWAEPEQPAVRFGRDLFPPATFEKALMPWRVEAWNGKGSGELDDSERHGGRRSVRIEVPAGESANAVTVLVWPQWGKNRLRVTLEGERTYELSAWVKLRDRRTAPGLRLTLPKGAATVKSGADPPTNEGWRRLWLRATTRYPVQPKYLAVWVQGPGVVWVDDLRLREVIPPGLQVSLDQSLYDEHDRVGVATVTLAKRVRPARLQFRLSSAQGLVADWSAPFRTSAVQAGKDLAVVAPAELTSCRFVFRPSKLPEGDYALEVRALDKEGKPLAEKRCSFRRVASHLLD